jgi:SH3 domain protein
MPSLFRPHHIPLTGLQCTDKLTKNNSNALFLNPLSGDSKVPFNSGKMRRYLLLFSTLLLFFSAEPVFSAVGYVTDVSQIPLRTGASSEHRIIAMPSSGQALEILGSEGDWSHVRLVGESEKEGWVLSRHIIARQPWEMQAKALKEENTALRQKTTSLETKLGEVLRQKDDLTKRADSEIKAFHGLQQDYDSLKKGSENYLKLKVVQEEAEKKLTRVEKELDEMTIENRQLRSSERTQWLATGAVVLLTGLIIGITIGKREKRRRSFLA